MHIFVILNRWATKILKVDFNNRDPTLRERMIKIRKVFIRVIRYELIKYPSFTSTFF